MLTRFSSMSYASVSRMKVSTASQSATLAKSTVVRNAVPCSDLKDVTPCASACCLIHDSIFDILVSISAVCCFIAATMASLRLRNVR